MKYKHVLFLSLILILIIGMVYTFQGKSENEENDFIIDDIGFSLKYNDSEIKLWKSTYVEYDSYYLFLPKIREEDCLVSQANDEERYITIDDKNIFEITSFSIGELHEYLEGLKLTIGAKAAATGKIFGSVNAIQIANAIKEACNIEIDRKQIVMNEEAVKELGNYKAKIKLHKDVQTEVEFEVVAE